MKLDNNNKAWKILTDEEKTALSLQFAYDKSTWQAGEIMGKAHYKYLEIKQRAEKFLKVFTEYFQIYRSLVPNGVTIDPDVKQYFEEVIINRKTIQEAVNSLSNKSFKLTSEREKAILEEFNKLKSKEDFNSSAFIGIVLEFDRWNNFRILPREIQEPSAYKRRNKNRLKKQIKNIYNLNPFVAEKMIERFSCKKTNEFTAYLPVILEKGKNYHIITIDTNKATQVEQINKIGLFIFKDYSKALEFCELLISFDINKPKDCKKGLLFWPQYRLLIHGALNYTEVENIIPSRKYIDSTLNDWDMKMVRSIKKE